LHIYRSYSHVETSGGIQASLAGRYASALFGLARDERQIDAVGRSLDSLDRALAESPDLAALVASPMVSREEAGKALAAVGASLSLDPITANFLGVLARNGRKAALKDIIRTFRRLAADHRGETTAEVVTAHPLKDDQVAALKAQLRSRAGRDVAIDATVDPAILGGIKIKMGSQMIDASIQTKLNRLATAMKG
jgi:F-type H+-transporting ATPase subunit delta